MQVHDKRMWLVESHLYRRCTEEMMERWLKAIMTRSLDTLSRFLPDRKFTKALIRGPRGELTATVSERERDSRDLPAKEWGHAELQFTAAPGTCKDGIRGWSVHSTDIACLSKEDVRRYLYEQAVAAAVHLSGFTRNPSHPFLPGEIKEDGRGTLYAYVTCQGLDDLGDLARDAGGGRKFSFTAKPWGYDSMRFPAGRDKTLATEDKDMVVFYANKQPEAYKAAYRDEGEAIEEFRAKLGRYLPADYDYGAHIGYFRYCIYC